MDFRLLDWESLMRKGSPSLFRSFNGKSISFYIHLDDNETKKYFEDIVLKKGGFVVENYVRMTSKTVLLVDDKQQKGNFDRVSFKVSYIVDCINSNKLLNINNYIHNSTPEFLCCNYMDIFYLRKSSSKNKCMNPCKHCNVALKKKAEGTSLQQRGNKHCSTCHCDEVDNHKDLEQSNSRPYTNNSDLSSDTEPNTQPGIPSCSSTSVDENHSDGNETYNHDVPRVHKCANNANHFIISEEEDDIGPPSIEKNISKHTKQPYTRKEKEAILKYILKKDAIKSVGGILLWKKMERNKVCPNRSWMSMQNHFKRTLINELEIYPFLTSDQIKAFKR